jgi:acyl-CoA hydrolase
VHVGELVHVTARLTWTGRTSVETRVIVESEKVLTGEVRRTNTAYLVFVALDHEAKPRAVPPLLIETPDDQAEWDAAELRRAQRMART